MLYVKYGKFYHKHDKVSEVKKLLKQAHKHILNIVAYTNSSLRSGYNYDLQLTGIDDVDYRTVRRHLDQAYTTFIDSLNSDTLMKDNLSEHLKVMTFLCGLQKALDVIATYPIVPGQCLVYRFKSTVTSEMRKEFFAFLRDLPSHTYNLEILAISPGGVKNIYPMNFVEAHLSNAHTIKAIFQ